MTLHELMSRPYHEEATESSMTLDDCPPETMIMCVLDTGEIRLLERSDELNTRSQSLYMGVGHRLQHVNTRHGYWVITAAGDLIPVHSAVVTWPGPE